MTRAEVEKTLEQRPFSPLKIRLDDGSTVDVPFAHVAIPMSRTLIVMQGVKSETSHSAIGKVEFAYNRIIGIEPRKSRNGQRRRKAS
jgi:hypothetical protein